MCIIKLESSGSKEGLNLKGPDFPGGREEGGASGAWAQMAAARTSPAPPRGTEGDEGKSSLKTRLKCMYHPVGFTLELCPDLPASCILIGLCGVKKQMSM